MTLFSAGFVIEPREIGGSGAWISVAGGVHAEVDAGEAAGDFGGQIAGFGFVEFDEGVAVEVAEVVPVGVGRDGESGFLQRIADGAQPCYFY